MSAPNEPNWITVPVKFIQCQPHQWAKLNHITSYQCTGQWKCVSLCLQSFVYRKSSARYSGHINSRLMRVWAQRDQTSHNSYYMRGKQKEHSSSACWKTCYDLFESLLVPLIIHIEVERTTCATKFNVSVKYTSTMGWLASLGPSHRCTCLPGYTDLG